MFLVNWLASSSLFRRVGGVPPIEVQDESDGQGLSKTLTKEEELKSEDLMKLCRIKFLWRKVAKELGIDNAEQVRFAVQKRGVEGAETAVTVWHEGSPTIVIPFDYLARSVVLDGDEMVGNNNFDRREWDIWSRFVDKCPDQVSEMFAYTEG